MQQHVSVLHRKQEALIALLHVSETTEASAHAAGTGALPWALCHVWGEWNARLMLCVKVRICL